MTLEHGVHDRRGAVAVLERRERRRPRAGSRHLSRLNRGIDVAHHVAEGVGPGFLMTSWKMRVGTRRVVQERRILQQHTIRPVTASDPELVLPLLVPANRGALAVG